MVLLLELGAGVNVVSCLLEASNINIPNEKKVNMTF